MTLPRPREFKHDSFLAVCIQLFLHQRDNSCLNGEKKILAYFFQYTDDVRIIRKVGKIIVHFSRLPRLQELSCLNYFVFFTEGFLGYLVSPPQLCLNFSHCANTGEKRKLDHALPKRDRSNNLTCSAYPLTGGPSSSCETIILRNNGHGGIIRVCIGIFTSALRNKKIRQILKKNTSPRFHSVLLVI